MSERDEAKIAIVREVLSRLEAGEKFKALAVLAVAEDYLVAAEGETMMLLAVGARFLHELNVDMDAHVSLAARDTLEPVDPHATLGT